MRQLPVGILLAAGKSERFGSNKLLYPLNNNKPMLISCAEKLSSVLPESVVVISQKLETHASDLEQLGLRVVVNERSECGIGSSIASGVRASPDASGWIIMLADMPYVQVATIEQLVDKLMAGARIVAPFFEEQRGHPVGFDRKYYDDLVSMNNDIGARQIIKNNLPLLGRVTTRDSGVIVDIDSREDLESIG
jgi:molybdenum cofactor cytidylyltransferase